MSRETLFIFEEDWRISSARARIRFNSDNLRRVRELARAFLRSPIDLNCELKRLKKYSRGNGIISSREINSHHLSLIIADDPSELSSDTNCWSSTIAGECKIWILTWGLPFDEFRMRFHCYQLSSPLSVDCSLYRKKFSFAGLLCENCQFSCINSCLIVFYCSFCINNGSKSTQ